VRDISLLFILVILLSSFSCSRMINKVDANKSIVVSNPFLYVWNNKSGSVEGMRRFFLDLDNDGRREVFISPNVTRKKGGSTFFIFRGIKKKKYRLMASVYLEPGLFKILNASEKKFPPMEMILNLKEGEKGRIVRRYDYISKFKSYRLSKAIKFKSMKAAMRYLKPLNVVVEKTKPANRKKREIASNKNH
jgi:hypothetical protein